MKKGVKKSLVNFYDIFQIGVEIEGEFLEDNNEVLSRNNDFDIVSDGSINGRADGNCQELRSNIIKSKENQVDLISHLKSLEKNDIDEGRKQFAHSNPTAGIHVHFSFKEEYKNELKELLGQDNKDYYLYLFDSIDFERYFFGRFFNKFKLIKFWRRLENQYCRSFIPYRGNGEIATGNVNLLDIENNKKHGGDDRRYRWLNCQSIIDNKGFEIRVFPNIITAKGLEQVIEFTKDVLLSYYLKSKNQKSIDKINEYFEVKYNYNLDSSKLKKYDLILFNSLLDSRESYLVSMDYIEAYLYVFKKNKKAFIRNNN